MRWIGNKTKLLREIESVLRARAIESGTFIDVFSGTAAVARHFKTQGFRILANDLLSVCYTQAVASVEASTPPAFSRLLQAWRSTFLSREFLDSFLDEATRQGFCANATLVKNLLSRGDLRKGQHLSSSEAETLPLRVVVHFLNRFVEPLEGLIFRNFCPGGIHGRRYFRDSHGMKIDGILQFLRKHHRAGLLEHTELHLVLSALIHAADRKANISGTYGAYLKRWQSNTVGELQMQVPHVVPSSRRGHRVFQEDANRLIRRIRGDVLYIDPPYNHRQYAANYHVLEIMAEYHRIPDLKAFEVSLYGKTGLRPYGDLFSDYCVSRESRRGQNNVYRALRDLVLSARVQHVVLSYNEEGLLTRDDLGEILALFSGARRFNFKRDFREIEYRRFRSDRDRKLDPSNRRSRRYRVVEGKGKDRIGEWLFVASRRESGSKSPTP